MYFVRDFVLRNHLKSFVHELDLSQLRLFCPLTVTIRAGHFWPNRSKIDLRGTKHTWILKVPLRTPPKIKFHIFWYYLRKPEMKFSKFHRPEMGRKLWFLLIWVIFLWGNTSVAWKHLRIFGLLPVKFPVKKMWKCEKSDATVNHDFIQFKYHVMVMKMEIFDREDRYGTNCISIQTYSHDK